VFVDGTYLMKARIENGCCLFAALIDVELHSTGPEMQKWGLIAVMMTFECSLKTVDLFLSLVETYLGRILVIRGTCL
jgi:hypothetical protein